MSTAEAAPAGDAISPTCYTARAMQMFSSRRESPEEFWRRTEEELGETVEVYTIGKCLEGCGADEREVWGLFFVTAGALYFRHFPSSNWFSAMLQGVTDPTSPREGIYFSIPLEDISEARIERETSLIRRIFRYSPPRIRLRYRDAHNVQTVMCFIPETKLEEMHARLAAG
ncbi:MAG: hypothetical protein ACLFPO_10645 [Spirochaetaceae bacterium]